MYECASSSLKVFHMEDRAPDLEEPEIKKLENSSAELSEDDKDKKGPDVVDIETKRMITRFSIRMFRPLQAGV